MPLIMELTCCEDAIQQAIDAGCTQRQVAETYAMAICSSWPTDWRRVNDAVSKRWPKGLMRIKEKAWTIVRKHASPRASA